MQLVIGIAIGVIVTLICVGIYWATHLDLDIDFNLEDIGTGKW